MREYFLWTALERGTVSSSLAGGTNEGRTHQRGDTEAELQDGMCENMYLAG